MAARCFINTTAPDRTLSLLGYHNTIYTVMDKVLFVLAFYYSQFHRPERILRGAVVVGNRFLKSTLILYIPIEQSMISLLSVFLIPILHQPIMDDTVFHYQKKFCGASLGYQKSQ